MTKLKTKPPAKLHAFWKRLTPDLREQFTALMDSTPGNVRQYAEGRRGINPATAIRIEKASIELGVTKPLNRTDLNETCAGCEYAKIAKQCLKKGSRS